MSGKRLADYVFDTDTAKLPKTGPTDQALDAILENPTVAKKALKLTLTALGKGPEVGPGNPIFGTCFGSFFLGGEVLFCHVFEPHVRHLNGSLWWYYAFRFSRFSQDMFHPLTILPSIFHLRFEQVWYPPTH